MSPRPHRPVITRRNLIGFVAIEVILFLIANITAKTKSHPGLVSSVFWVAFLIGIALLILVALVRLLASDVGGRLRRS